MVTDEQVSLLRKKMTEGQTQETAASAAGMSVRTAREWQTGSLPSATKRPRKWRTRPDAFAAVWDTEVVPVTFRAHRQWPLRPGWHGLRGACGGEAGAGWRLGRHRGSWRERVSG
jgi:hypothetical protein